MQVNPLKVNVSISEQYYPLIKNGMKAIVSADVYPMKYSPAGYSGKLRQ